MDKLATKDELNLPAVQNEPMTIANMEQYAKYFVASGMFPDMNTLSKAVVKIMAGTELGKSPFWSMKNIDLIQGKPEINAGGLSDLVKSSGRYDYQVKEWDDKHCVIEWYDLKNWGKDRPIGISSWSEAEAIAAGLAGKDNWKKYPKAMYFARALSQGARTYAPDSSGGTIYVTGEISEARQLPEEIAADKEKSRIAKFISEATKTTDLEQVMELVDQYDLRPALEAKLSELEGVQSLQDEGSNKFEGTLNDGKTKVFSNPAVAKDTIIALSEENIEMAKAFSNKEKVLAKAEEYKAKGRKIVQHELSEAEIEEEMGKND